jgi:hypothetical protein
VTARNLGTHNENHTSKCFLDPIIVHTPCIMAALINTATTPLGPLLGRTDSLLQEQPGSAKMVSLADLHTTNTPLVIERDVDVSLAGIQSRYSWSDTGAMWQALSLTAALLISVFRESTLWILCFRPWCKIRYLWQPCRLGSCMLRLPPRSSFLGCVGRERSKSSSCLNEIAFSLIIFVVLTSPR